MYDWISEGMFDNEMCVCASDFDELGGDPVLVFASSELVMFQVPCGSQQHYTKLQCP